MERSHSLHIGISGRAMGFPFGGVKEYAVGITRELLKLGSPHRFSIYYPDSSLLGTNPDATEVYLASPHKSIWDHWTLPRHLMHDRPDVVFFPHNVMSCWLNIPSVVTVHDLLYFRVPEFPYREYPWPDTLYMRMFIPRSLRRARRIIADSDWTAYDVERLIGISRDKVTTITPPCSDEFKPLAEAECTAVKVKYGLGRPFFFYSGVPSIRKNISVLIDAFAGVQHEVPHDLVLVGGSGPAESALRELIHRHGIGDRVRRLGVVPKSDLIALYNTAEAFIFPSLYEGLGFPPMEAFSCGCPVISSSATSLAEVVGDGALTFEPRDVARLEIHLKAVAHDPALRANLRQAGFERMKHFSHRAAARVLLQQLEAAAGEPGQ